VINLALLVIAASAMVGLIYFIQEMFDIPRSNLLKFIGRRYRKNIKIKEQNERVIIHEAAHAIVSWYCSNFYNIRIELFSYNPDPDKKMAGVCRIDPISNENK